MKIDWIETVAFLTLMVYVLCYASVIVLLAWVAYHFISKFW